MNRRKALFAEALALVPRGPTIDITAFPVEEGEDAFSAEDALERYWTAALPAERVTVSTDGGGCLPRFDAEHRIVGMDVGQPSALIDTIRTLLARGHALDRILPPFTSNVARLLRLAGKGTIAVGADADLVVLSADNEVEHVMAHGRWHLHAGTARILGPFEKGTP